MNEYADFLESKSQLGTFDGFKPTFTPDFLYDFQEMLVDWSVRKGKAAIFADCGMGKTPMQLVWAQNVVEKTGGRVLIVTPLAVSAQTGREAEKFQIDAWVSRDGKWPLNKKIIITNYERLHYFDRNDFVGMVCDESSILKNFSGKRKHEITQFMTKLPYRLLCTATAAPNDYVELATSSEALGELGYSDVLERFFKNTQNICNTAARWVAHGGPMPQWVFKKHAEHPFWQWMCSWARAIRKPSDMGYDDSLFTLPELIENQILIDNLEPPPGMFFAPTAITLHEQRDERRRTIQQRCEKVAELVNHDKSVIAWCHLNAEGDLLEELIPDAVQISGSDSDDKKEETFTAFTNGDLRALVTKPKIGAFGMNWQHCSHMTFFPSHSYEQYYQAVRRCWRYGQTESVTVDVVTTPGEETVLKNLQRKANQADKMFTLLVQYMTDELQIERENPYTTLEEIPSWL